MVEKIKKYKFGIRRFGLVNWVGAWTLYQRSSQIFKCLGSNNFSPLVSSLLFNGAFSSYWQ